MFFCIVVFFLQYCNQKSSLHSKYDVIEFYDNKSKFYLNAPFNTEKISSFLKVNNLLDNASEGKYLFKCIDLICGYYRSIKQDLLIKEIAKLIYDYYLGILPKEIENYILNVNSSNFIKSFNINVYNDKINFTTSKNIKYFINKRVLFIYNSVSYNLLDYILIEGNFIMFLKLFNLGFIGINENFPFYNDNSPNKSITRWILENNHKELKYNYFIDIKLIVSHYLSVNMKEPEIIGYLDHSYQKNKIAYDLSVNMKKTYYLLLNNLYQKKKDAKLFIYPDTYCVSHHLPKGIKLNNIENRVQEFLGFKISLRK